MACYSLPTTTTDASQSTPISAGPDQQLPSLRVAIPSPATNMVSRLIVIPWVDLQHTRSMNSSTMLPPEQVKSNPMGYDTIANSSMQSDILIAADAEYSCPWSRSSSYIDSAHSMGVLCVLPPQAQQLDMSHWERPASDAHLMWQTPQVGLTPYTMDHSGYGHAYDQYRGSIVDGGTYRSMDTSPSDMKHDELMSCPMMGNPSHANHRRRRGDLPKNITDVLRMWLEENLDHPYPSNEEKQDFVQRTGLTISQVSNWFINARRRQLPAMKTKKRKALCTWSQ